MNTHSKPICDTDPSRRGGIDLNAEALGDLYKALKEAEREFRRIANPHTHQSCLWAGFADRCAAALRKVEQVKS